ncbi:MAG: TMEM175 family protein [Acidobacteriota bacterium]|nr:TMEM175 family protein [Acidobacteriota bacterium]
MAERSVGSARGFRWRAGEVSRLEGFTDAVFAFAVTLLVVSLEVPRTFTELVLAMRGFLAFAICFVLLFLIWYEHYVYSRRYGLDDTTVVWLNGALIFVVLFYVYPLKFMFTMVVNGVFGFQDPARGSEPILRASDGPTLFLIFGAGYVAVFLVFTLLYLHAWRKRGELGLTDIEIHDTRSRLWSAVLTGATGVASIFCVLLFGEQGARWAGPIYLLNGLTLTAHGFWWGSRRRRLEAVAPR